MCDRWAQASAGGPGRRSPSPPADSGGTGSERVKQDSDVAGEGRVVQGIAGTPPNDSGQPSAAYTTRPPGNGRSRRHGAAAFLSYSNRWGGRGQAWQSLPFSHRVESGLFRNPGAFEQKSLTVRGALTAEAGR